MTAPAIAAPADPATVERLIREMADEIPDPCSVAAAHPLGLSEMGLLTEVSVAEPDRTGRRAVSIRLRLTAPGCLYWLYFERELIGRAARIPSVGTVTIERDPSYDWDESDIAPAARRRLQTQRQARLAAASGGPPPA
jgi:metal-sulfur cluster biosynthetic enzyme